MKTKITAHERLQLIGLLMLAEQYVHRAADVERAIADLLGDDRVVGEAGGGHIQDAVYDDGHRDVDALLHRLEIVVED